MLTGTEHNKQLLTDLREKAKERKVDITGMIEAAEHAEDKKQLLRELREKAKEKGVDIVTMIAAAEYAEIEN